VLRVFRFRQEDSDSVLLIYGYKFNKTESEWMKTLKALRVGHSFPKIFSLKCYIHML